MAKILKLAIKNIYPNYQHYTDIWPLKIYIQIISIILISIQVLILDFIFPVYKIDREQSEKMFLRNA
jgi:hypothetical protein